MTSQVLYTPFESSGKLDNLSRRVAMLVNRAGFFDSTCEGDSVAVKVHPGERGNLTYLRPAFARSVVEQLKRRGASPFVTETTTLYCRQRFTAEELVATAAWNGYSADTMGCPFLVADSGPDATVPVDGIHLREAGVAESIAGADSLAVLTHPTAHPWTAGLGGAIKQLGMGCVGRKTKAEVHLSTTITINENLCDACGKCSRVCKRGAIRMTEESAVLTDHCARCGVCIDSCPQGAIDYSHDHEWFALSLAEAASGVMSCFGEGRVVFISYLLDITWHCDCEGFSDRPVFDDLGVLVSTDPVAIDQATADLMNSAAPLTGSKADTPEVVGARDRLQALSRIEWWKQLEHAEALGLGTRQYSLKEIRS